MARTLAQLIMTERTVRKIDNDRGSEIRNALAKETSTLGQVKQYKPDNEPQNPNEIVPPVVTVVQHRVEDDLDTAMRYAVAAMDATATKDTANCHAAADLVVDDTVLVPKVPISHLLWLEGYLQEWQAFLAMLPVLSPAREWTYDANARHHRSVPEEQVKTSKETVPLVLHPGNDKHPPQAERLIQDVRIGKTVTTVLSGAISAQRKTELLDRMSAVLLGVKDAIARANRTEVAEVAEGQAILGYILRR